MRKYAWIIVLTLIIGTVIFTSCRRMEQMISPAMPDAEIIEPPPEMVVQTPVETVMEAEPASTALKDPNSDGDGEWIDLERHAPDTLSTLSSTIISGSQDEIAELQTVIIFVNCTETDISSYWLNHDRNEVLYQTLAPGESYRQLSWEGHVWIVKDAAKNNIALYIAQDETGRALLMAPGMPAPEPPAETVVETPAETPPEMVETPPETVEETPEETTDLHGGMVGIEDAMSTIGLRKIYWIPERDGLMRGNPDGSGIETLPVGTDNLGYQTRNLVVDSEGGKIYWNDTEGGLWRANLDGTNIEHIVTTPVQNFTLDLEAGKIYWIARIDWSTLDTEHLFQRSNLDGSGVEKFKTISVSALLPYLNAIAFDPIERKIYAINDSKMFVINPDDLDIKFADIEFEWSTGAQGSIKETLTLDIEERKIYWVIRGGNSKAVYRVNLDGTDRERVLTGYREGQPTFSDLAATFDFNTRKIYWSGSGNARNLIWQTNLDGSGSEALFALPDTIRRIAVETGPIN